MNYYYYYYYYYYYRSRCLTNIKLDHVRGFRETLMIIGFRTSALFSVF